MMPNLIVLLLLFSFVRSDEVFCSDSYCEDYLNKNSCPSIPDNCEIQNSTHNGVVLPFPGPCQCCDFCLSNLVEGEQCSVGSSNSPLAATICGDGLICNTNSKTCSTMETGCSKSQKDYDERKQNGELGHLEMRPVCDGDGKYKPYKCIPNEICYCVNEDNERIFGEMEFTDFAEYIMKCGCSRAFSLMEKSLNQALNPLNRFRCMPDGSFDTLQCIGDNCICVDSNDGTPTSTDVVPRTSLKEGSLPCFNKSIHVPYFYYYDCESSVIEKIIEFEDLTDQGYDVFGITLPNCNIDGKYGLVQMNSTHKYCSAPDGNLIENFIVEIESNLAKDMNCVCAKSRSLITLIEKPTCLQNGNYNPMQCRRGKCRCVDKNGNQNKLEVPYENKDDLKCNNT